MFGFLKRIFSSLMPEPARRGRPILSMDDVDSIFHLSTEDMGVLIEAMESIEPLSPTEKNLIKAKLQTLKKAGVGEIALSSEDEQFVKRLAKLSRDMRENKLSKMELQILREQFLEGSAPNKAVLLNRKIALKALEDAVKIKEDMYNDTMKEYADAAPGYKMYNVLPKLNANMRSADDMIEKCWQDYQSVAGINCGHYTDSFKGLGRQNSLRRGARGQRRSF